MIDLIELIDKTKLKTDRAFLERLHNGNYSIMTESHRLINSAYKFKDKLNLSIKRVDYSNEHIITVK